MAASGMTTCTKGVSGTDRDDQKAVALTQNNCASQAALALALEEGWWPLLNEQRALTFARQHGLKVMTVPEFIVCPYQTRLLSSGSARTKLDGIAAITGQRVMEVARHAFETLAHSRGER